MKTIKKSEDIIIEDITIESKEILSNAMNNFCKVENKEEKEKKLYIDYRHNYWLGQGYTNEEAIIKANEDYEWAFKKR